MNHTAKPAFLSYKKSRFSTRLPRSRRYTPAHFWIEEVEPGIQRVGLTKFATRMLGELVETGMEVEPDASVEVGQIIGWVECLKAASDLFCMVQGTYRRANPALEEDPELLGKDPYFRGWLYEVTGPVPADSLDTNGYASFLDEVINKMLGESS